MIHRWNSEVAGRLRKLASRFEELAADSEAMYEGYAGGVDWEQMTVAWEDVDAIVHDLTTYAECMEKSLNSEPENQVHIE